MIQVGVLSLLLLGFPLIVPQYVGLQETVINEFNIADKAGEYYQGGVVVCDMPSMIYRMVVEWDIPPSSLLSNHYGPQYYGINDPAAYLDWIQQEDIRLWMYIGSRGDPVWAVLNSNYPGVLVNLFGEPGAGCYLVDRVLVDSLL